MWQSGRCSRFLRKTSSMELTGTTVCRHKIDAGTSPLFRMHRIVMHLRIEKKIIEKQTLKMHVGDISDHDLALANLKTKRYKSLKHINIET